MQRQAMWWTPIQLDKVDAALQRSRAGEPSILTIEGGAGVGKSTLVREIIARAEGFQILFGEGNSTRMSRPFALLAEWGALDAELSDTGRQRTISPFQAAQGLRDVVGRLQLVGPVLLLLDDLQWIDRESLDSLVWLFRRATGDRLLIVAAGRPLRPGAQPEWRRLLLDADIQPLVLDGLSREDARALIRTRSPLVDDVTALRLIEHTGGNPLYLNSILREHDADELRELDPLPVPSDLAARILPGLGQLAPDSLSLLYAIAILGADWVSMPTAAEVAAIDHPANALAVLENETLVEHESEGSAMRVRIVHSVFRTAVYDAIPAALRSQLHLAAATSLSSPAMILDHRVAAADTHDDALADDLQEFATELHSVGAYRDAGRFLRLASSATSAPQLREGRFLDSLFELLLARDVDQVTASIGEVSWAKDVVRRALVQGFLLVIEARWIEAVAVFATVSEAEADAADPLVQFRLLTLAGWSRISVGVPGEEVLPSLQRAVAMEALDPALTGYVTAAYGQAQMRTASPGALWGFADQPERQSPSDAAPSGGKLAWRGAVYALSGREDDAVRDLTAFTDRIRDGRADLGDGIFHALLGFSFWMRGDLRRATIPIGIARDAQFGAAHPMVVAVQALKALSDGDAKSARERVDASRDLLRRAPWPQAIAAAQVVETLVLRLTGSDSERAAYESQFLGDFGADTERGLVPLLRWLHGGVASVWAGNYDGALTRIERLDVSRLELPWRAAAVNWVRGLVAAGRGDADEGLRLLTTASGQGMRGLPVHQAILFADLADVAAAVGDRAASARAQTASTTEFSRLGLAHLVPTGNSAERAPSSIWPLLSEREIEVVALLVEGLSYAQIAKEIFLTRSTVAFHLSNIYAKTNTTSRHELVELIRSGS